VGHVKTGNSKAIAIASVASMLLASVSIVAVAWSERDELDLAMIAISMLFDSRPSTYSPRALGVRLDISTQEVAAARTSATQTVPKDPALARASSGLRH
jgi:hypothetical protein